MLIENKADPTLVDKDGWNPLDLAIVRINYQAARNLLKETDLELKSIEEYEGKTWRKYDLELMFESL